MGSGVRVVLRALGRRRIMEPASLQRAVLMALQASLMQLGAPSLERHTRAASLSFPAPEFGDQPGLCPYVLHPTHTRTSATLLRAARACAEIARSHTGFTKPMHHHGVDR